MGRTANIIRSISQIIHHPLDSCSISILRIGVHRAGARGAIPALAGGTSRGEDGIGVIEAKADAVTVGGGILSAQDCEARFITYADVEEAMERMLFGALERDDIGIIEESPPCIFDAD